MIYLFENKISISQPLIRIKTKIWVSKDNLPNYQASHHNYICHSLSLCLHICSNNQCGHECTQSSICRSIHRQTYNNLRSLNKNLSLGPIFWFLIQPVGCCYQICTWNWLQGSVFPFLFLSSLKVKSNADTFRSSCEIIIHQVNKIS